MVPGIRKPQAVAAKQVNAVGLTNVTHNPGIFDRHLLGQDDSFFQIWVFAHRFGDPILHPGRRQIDHHGIKFMTRIESFFNRIVNGNLS